MSNHLFAKNLRYLRRKGNHNQDEISLLFNKRPNTVGNWENQKSEPSLAELMRLGDFFQVSVQDLLNRDLENDKVSGGSTPNSGNDSPDSFWLILRELKSLNEKLDSVSAGLKNGGLQRQSDKSYH